jgi:DNA gyrase subunit A
MLISSTGTLVRTPVRDISIVGRNTQGVRLIRLAEGERLTGIERVEGLENGDGDGDVLEAPDAGGDDSAANLEGSSPQGPAE